MHTGQIRIKLREKGLKATPKRVSIVGAIIALDNHPTAEEIFIFLRNQNINIAMATVYKALDILVARKILIRVETEKQAVRYDSVIEPHHHLYSTGSDIIKDYHNEELNKVLSRFFKKHKIKDFDIEEIKLQIIGNFKNLNE